MKHYRILERKISNDITINAVGKKEYIIQYLKKFIFGLYYWKKVNNTIYYKYEEAFNETKKLMLQSDYENEKYGYHYIDAYKIFKGNNKEIVTEATKENFNTAIKETQTKKKSTFVPKQTSNTTKTNKTVFIPRQ